MLSESGMEWHPHTNTQTHTHAHTQPTSPPPIQRHAHTHRHIHRIWMAFVPSSSWQGSPGSRGPLSPCLQSHGPFQGRILKMPAPGASVGYFTTTQWKLREILANFKENTVNCCWHSPQLHKQALGLITHIIVIVLPITFWNISFLT